MYVGNIGWNVYSFVRTSGTSGADLDLNAFLQALVRRGLMQRTDWLSSVEAGTEAFTGRAQLGTESYSTTVG
ncbi:GH12 family glycosyl hydrolase domain-containing protein [Kitasatospora sp. KL5]|uniref:GH12 family glycosyl hydrolase domain-containing protein n=1 Tax=Kitasatospora sp. KL5 TaxID=3425125 RepID=UPI003D6FDF80